MKNSRLAALAPLLLALSPTLTLAQDGSSCGAEFEPRSLFERTAAFAEDPVPQIQAHFAMVIDRLEAADTSGLSSATLARRGEQIAELAAYSAAGVFPINRSLKFPSPIFIDDSGRACAVGHLMIESGAGSLAERIRAESNFAYVPDIAIEGAADWMRRVGLSMEECAWIQPAYGPCGNLNGPIHSGTTCTPTTLNSAGLLAAHWACGSTDVAANDVYLIIGGLPVGSVGYFLNARDASAMVQPGTSQGTLCLGGAIGRHDAQVFTAFAPSLNGPVTGPGWWSAIVLDLAQMPTPAGAVAVLPGDTWYFQAWYRDVNPAPTSNLSDVIWITFS